MVRDVFMSTNLQRALGLLAEHPDQSYFVKEVTVKEDKNVEGITIP